VQATARRDGAVLDGARALRQLQRRMCPHCRTDAPLVYRGVQAYCSACGRPRSVLSGASLTHAGKPARIGGAVVQVFGWAALVLGLFVALLLGGVVAAAGALTGLFTATAGWVVGGLVALLTVIVFWALRRGGKKLEQHGDETLEQRREQALFALAANHGGVLQAEQVARSLEVPVEQAQELLTRLAKERQNEVGLEVGEQGELFYTFTRYLDPSRLPGADVWGPAARERVRIAEPVRIDASGAVRPAEPVRIDGARAADPTGLGAVDEPLAPGAARRRE
jgi:hypothetical protein